jgi:capsular polysaccharide biosynthesis protein
LPYVDDVEVAPSRKVFVSRKKVEDKELSLVIDKAGNERLTKVRMDDEKKLERLFSSLGFDIVYPEDFSDFKEQINFFYSVKTIASLTSSGLSNCAFMQPGGNVIEITTPLTVAPIGNDGSVGTLGVEIHHFYKHLAYQKGHFYWSIPNPNLKINEMVKLIKSNDWLKRMLKEV